MDYSTVPNTALIHLCGQNPKNRAAWIEFYARFDERIRLVVYRECRNNIQCAKNAQFTQIVQDMVQDVYVKLIQNQAKALKDFNGRSDNSIYLYLGMIAKNTVRNHVIKTNAKKRPSIKKSINEPLYYSDEQGPLFLHDRLHPRYSNTEEQMMIEELQDEIDSILNQVYKGRNRERNKIIFRLFFYEGFTPEDIATQFGFNLSVKRIGNLISDIRKKLKETLTDQIPTLRK